MEEPYRIEVHHFLNPHFIWVETLVAEGEWANPSGNYQQVGLFGVLPAQCSGDGATNAFLKVRTQEWTPAAVKIMDGLLIKAREVWFMPVVNLNNSTIFNDHTHILGEIFLLNDDDSITLLSKHLYNSGLAFAKKSLFQQVLNSNRQLGKLETDTADEVIQLLSDKLKGNKKRFAEFMQRTSFKREMIDTLNSVKTNLGKFSDHPSLANMSEKDVDNIIASKTLEISQTQEQEQISSINLSNKTKKVKPIKPDCKILLIRHTILFDLMNKRKNSHVLNDVMDVNMEDIEYKPRASVKDEYEKLLRRSLKGKCVITEIDESSNYTSSKKKATTLETQQKEVICPAGGSFANVKLLPKSAQTGKTL